MLCFGVICRDFLGLQAKTVERIDELIVRLTLRQLFVMRERELSTMMQKLNPNVCSV